MQIGADRGPDGPMASPFPPIKEYGFLSDCEVMALVAPSGNVEWLCLPRPDAPSVFGAMLDRDAGGFRLGPGGGPGAGARRSPPRPPGPRGPPRPPLPAGDHGAGNELGHRGRLDHCAGPAAVRALA